MYHFNIYNKVSTDTGPVPHVYIILKVQVNCL